MSNKLIKDPKRLEEIKKEEENRKYLEGKPTRIEVANYVNALLENKYFPEILGKLELGFAVLQTILVNNGITTVEEIEKLTKEFIKIKEEKKEEKADEKSKS